MKLIYKIAHIAKVLVPVCCLASCNYLDVVPLEKEDIKDVMKNEDAVLSFVYSCYSDLQYGHTDGLDYRTFESSTDEFVLPQLWERSGQVVSWNQLTSIYTPNWMDRHPWNVIYDAIGRCNLFLKLIEELKPDITEEKKARFIAEVKSMKAFYYSRLLERFGPVPIIDTYPSMDISKDKYPGRSHYDFCVDYIVKLLDDVIESGALTPTVPTADLGRVTITSCKALKARVLLTAASPLWNGSFPYRNWKNTKYETPGCGQELVSQTYNVKKWERALAACEDALTYALADGKRALFSLNLAESIRTHEGVPLPFVPGVDGTTPEGQTFLQRVSLMKYAITAIETQGNTERIWGASFQDENLIAALPHNIVQVNGGSWKSGYSGVSPTLNTVEHFYTANGELPDYDPTFPSKEERLTSAGLSNPDIIKLNVDREPRYYAWIAFDGGEYGSVISDGKRLMIDFKKSDKQGYSEDFNRDNCVTGFLSKKYALPSYRFRTDGGDNYGDGRYPYAIIRLPELYLNLAECCAYLAEKEGRAEYAQKVLDNLNALRVRAGIRELTSADVKGDMTMLKWVESERFIELWGEGRRYNDARRWMTAPKYFKAGVREGLNALRKDPTFGEFNQRVKIDQPFQWTNRMYITPLLSKEVYSNPQLVQAPEY